MSGSDLPILLRRIADELDVLEPNSYWDAWSAVYRELENGNPGFMTKVGQTGVEAAVEEIRRLYQVEQWVLNLAENMEKRRPFGAVIAASKEDP